MYLYVESAYTTGTYLYYLQVQRINELSGQCAVLQLPDSVDLLKRYGESVPAQIFERKKFPRILKM